jgi:flavin reductase (DIM6/NTAB) family NADH-FMN oxidoreductase RutF
MTSTPNAISIPFDSLSRSDRYHFMTSTIVPRPIAVVATQDSQGRDNLAPFSYFNAVSSDPACLMFSMGKKRDPNTKALLEKDTLRNIRLNSEFVVHIAHASQVGWVEAASEELEYGQSERAQLGLTQAPSKWIRVPRIVEFPVAFECRLNQFVEMGANTMVIGEILGAHLQPDLKVPSEWRADFKKLDPLARLGREYGRIQIL